MPKEGTPCLVIDSQGFVVAANDRANQLLGHGRRGGLVGSHFGAWGPELDHTDLDVIRVRGGKLQTASVRARRYADPAVSPQFTSIVFEEAPGLELPLSQALGLTALELLHSARIAVSFLELPLAVQVGEEFREMIRLWMEFFRNASNNGEASLAIRANATHHDELEIEMCLRQPDPPPFREGSTELHDLEDAADAVEALHGTFQLRVEYPDIVVRIHAPCHNPAKAAAAAAGAS